MKIVGIDTFTLRIPTVKPIALDLPEHRLVVTRIHSDSGPEGLGYSLVFGGAGSEAVAATTIEYSSAPFSSSTFTNCATVERFWPTAT